MLCNLPWFNQVSNGEDDTKDNADTANDDIGDAEEGISSTHDGSRRDKNGLGASIDRDWEV